MHIIICILEKFFGRAKMLSRHWVRKLNFLSACPSLCETTSQPPNIHHVWSIPIIEYRYYIPYIASSLSVYHLIPTGQTG